MSNVMSVSMSWGSFLKLALRTCLLLLLALVLGSGAVEGQVGASLDSAESWLLSKQHLNGSFGDIPGLEPRDSAATVLALSGRTSAEPGVTRGTIFIHQGPAANTSFHARRALALEARGRSVDNLLAELRQFENGGGLGASKDYHSNLLDTALAIEALALDETSYLLEINGYLDFLQLHQGADGGWGYAPAEVSDLYFTAQILQALKAPGQLIIGQQVVDAAAGFIISRQQPDGSFGDPLTTAVAYSALLAAGISETDLAMGSPVAALLAAQSHDGSWGDDVFTTATVVSSLQNHLPNLEISELSVSPQPLLPGQPATVTLTVDNSGGLDAAACELTLRFGDAAGPLAGSATLVPLAAGSQRAIEITIEGEDTQDIGPFLDLFAEVDSTDQVAETDEDDNQSFLRVDLSRAADLAVWASDIQSIPQRPEPEVAFEVTLPVRNVGESEAPSVAWTLTRNVASAPVEVLASGILAPLAGGGNEVLTVPVTLPEGDHTLEIWVDSDQAFEEEQEENNRTSFSLSVVDSQRPDLAFEAGQLALDPALPESGESVQVAWTLANLGLQGVTADVALYAQDAAGVSEVPLATWTVSVEASGSVSEGTALVPPPGAHSLVLIADPDNQWIELDESNNRLREVFRPLSDLAIGWDNMVLKPSQPLAGEAVVVTVTVRNGGFIAADSVDLVVKDERSGDIVFTQQFASLPAQGNRSASFTWAASPGLTTLAAEIDPDGVVDELDEGNNLRRYAVAVPRSGGPNLRVEALDTTQLQTDPLASTVSGQLGVQLGNTGDATASAPFTVRVFEDPNGDRLRSSDEPVLAQGVVDSALAAGTTTEVLLSLDATLAFHHALVWVEVDAGDLVAEQLEDDNLMALFGECTEEPPVASLEPQVEWQIAGVEIESAPLVVQLSDDNGDGLIDSRDTPDVVFLGEDADGRGVFVHAGNDGRLLWVLRSSSTHPLPLPIGSLAAADLDGDGISELIVPRRDGRLMAVDSTGEVLWISDPVEGMGDRWAGAITVGELDGLGGPEIVVGRSVVSHQGELIALGTANRGRNTNYYGPLGVQLVPGAQDYPISVIADIDLDGRNELIAGDTAYRLQNGALTVVWDYDEPGNLMVDGFSAVGQLDADPEAEIVVVSSNSVIILEHDGTVARSRRQLVPFLPFTRGGFWGGPPTLADLDGDGVAEILVAGETEVVAMTSTLSTLWRGDFDDVAAIVGLTAFDLDGDGVREVLALDNRNFYILDGLSGNPRLTLPNTSKTATELPVVADVDGDGRAEVLVPSNRSFDGDTSTQGLRVLGDGSWQGSRKIWNQHAYTAQSVLLDGTVPSEALQHWRQPTTNLFRVNAALPAPTTYVANGSLSWPRQGVPGPEGLPLTLRLGNGSQAQLSAGQTVEFFLGATSEGQDPVLTWTSERALRPGGYLDFEVLWTEPLTSPMSVTAVLRHATHSEPTADCRPDDDSVTFVVDTSVLPDLTLGPEDFNLPSTVALGQQVPVTLNVHNRGHATASPSLGLLRLADPLAGPVVAQIEVPVLAAGASVELQASWDSRHEAAGTYALYAVLDSSDEVAEGDETNNIALRTVVLGAATQPDLSLETLQVQATAIAGDLVPVIFEVINRGADLVDGFEVQLEVNGAAAVQHAEPTLLAAGEHRQFEVLLDTAGRSGLLLLEGVVDPNAVIDELDEGNNRASAEFTVEPSDVAMSLSTDQVGYRVGESLASNLQVVYQGGTPEDVQLRVEVVDRLGVIVALLTDELLTLNPGTTSLDFDWVVGSSLPGTYVVRAELHLAGALRARAVRAFSVAAELDVAVDLHADRSAYRAGQTASLTGWIRNDSANAIVENLRAELRIQNDRLETVFSRLEDLPPIAPQSARSIFTPWSLAGVAPGTYQVRLMARDLHGLVLASRDLELVVEDSSQDGSGLFGALELDDGAVAAGAPLVSRYSLRNEGNADLADVDVRLALLAVPQGTRHSVQHLTLQLARTLTLEGMEILSTDGLLPGDYLLTLTAYLPSSERLLDTALVQVERAVSIGDGEIAEGDSGSTALRFSVRLSSPSDDAVSIEVSTLDGTAKGGEDYQSTSTTLAFLPGETEQFFDVDVLGDVLGESDETFLVRLQTPQGALVGDGLGRGLIRDEEGCAGPQLLLDGGLDASPIGDPNLGWQGNGDWSQRFIDVPQGTAALTSAVASELVQELDLTAYEQVLISGSVEFAVSVGVELGEGASASLQIEFLDAAGLVLQQDSVPAQTGVDGWQSVASRWLPPTTTRGVRLRLLAGGIGEVTFDDALVQILGQRSVFVDDLEVLEGNDNTAIARVPVRLSCAAPLPVDLSFVTSDGSALAGDDYQASSGVVQVPAGDLIAWIEIPLLGDFLNEADETLSVTVSDPSLAGPPIIDGESRVVLLNDDGVAQLSVADAAIGEGLGQALRFDISLATPSGRQVEVDYSLDVPGSPQDATPGTDFVVASGHLVFAPGELTQSVAVQILDDVLAEGDETLRLRLSSPVHAELSRAEGLGTIEDDELASLSVDHPSVLEGGLATFRVRLSHAATRPVEVSYSTADSMASEAATSSEDYEPTSGRLVFSPGTRFLDVDVVTLDDATAEPREVFLLQLSDPLHAALGVAEGTASIIDGDGLLLSAISLETSEEATDHTVTVAVELNQPSTETVTVEVATEDASALAGLDYQAAATTLTFAPGITRVEVPIIVLADVEAEDRETFGLRLRQPIGAQIHGDLAVVGLADDDRWSLVQKARPRAGEACFDLTTDVSFFERGAAWNRLPIDLTQHFDKTFRTYFGSSNGSRSGMVFVLQQESLGVVGGCCEDLGFNGIIPSVGVEFDQGDPDHVAVGLNGSRHHNGHRAINLPAPLADNQEHEVRVVWNSERHQLGVMFDGEEVLAYGNDLVASRFGGDPEVFWGWTGAYASASSRTPIQFFCDLDSCAHNEQATVSVGDARMLEGDDIGQMLLPLTLSCPSDEEVSVSYITADGTAIAGMDYRFAAETVVFAPGETSKSLVVEVFGDTDPEADETFFVDITSVSGAAVRHGRATATLQSDEIPLFLRQAEITEGNNGRTEWVAGVILESPVPVATTLNYQLVSGTAQVGSDFIADSGTLNFAAGQASIALPLDIQGDAVAEDDEVFYIDFTAPSGSVLVSQRVAVEIRDDDECPSSNLLINPSAEELLVDGDHVGWTEVVGDEWRKNSFQGAHHGSFYFWAGRVPFGELRQDVDVSGFAQRIDSGLQRFAFESWVRVRNESPRDTSRVVVEYRDATNTVILDAYDSNEHAERSRWRWLNDLRTAPPGTRFIRVRLLATRNKGSDNDGRFDDLSLRALEVPSLSVADVSVDEGVSGTSQALFPVTLTCPSDGSVRVDYLTLDGSAVAGEDYVATYGTLTFPAGSSLEMIAVPILGDAQVEGDEQFFLQLVHPQSSGLQDDLAVATLTEDEARLSLDNLTVAETDDDVIANLTLRLDSPAGLPVRVHLSSVDLEATAGEDYLALDLEVEIPAGETSLQVPLTILGDTATEAAEECFLVQLSQVINARLDDGDALVCIRDDDLTVSIGDVSVSEGALGEVVAYFPVDLSRAGANPVTVTWSTSDETATAGEDYLAANGQVTLAPGETRVEIPVVVLGDSEPELTELFNVTLSQAVGADLADAMGTGFIVDDDDCQSVDLLLNEGAELGVDGEVPSDWQVVSGANWRRFADANVLAVDGLRYFNAGDPGPSGDAELRQVVDVAGFAPWIDSGRQRFRFQGWVRSAEQPQPDLARLRVDYLDAAGQVLDGFDSGDVASVGHWRQITDLRSAPVGTRSLSVRLISRRSAAEGTSQAYFDALSLHSVGTPAVWLSVPGPMVDEVDLETSDLSFEVNLSCDEGTPIQVDYATSDGGGPVDQRAEAGFDYESLSGTLSFAVDGDIDSDSGGASRQLLPVVIVGDGDPEPIEYLTMNLSNPQGAVLLDAAVHGLVLDNDVAHIDRGYVPLQTAPGDGQVKIDLGAFGDWGTSTLQGIVPAGRGDALFDLPGPYGFGSTTYDYALLVRRLGTSEQWLTTSRFANSQNSQQANPGFVDFGATYANSVFLMEGLLFELRQTLHDVFEDGERVGGVLVQTYEVTNRLEEATEVDFIRYFDGDLEFGSNSGRQDGGGRQVIGDVEILFETDFPVPPEETSAFVGLIGQGGVELTTGRYELAHWDPNVPSLRNGGVPGNRVVGDSSTDDDELIDVGQEIDVALLLRNRFVNIAPRQSLTYRALTYFGQAVLDEYGLNLPPEAEISAPSAVYEGTTVTLDAGSSQDSDGQLVTYLWDLDDDGAFDDASGETADLHFEDQGAYAVGLQVIDDGGIGGTDRLQIVVLEAAPSVEAGAATSIDPGDTFALHAVYADPGVNDTHFAEVWWGDGTSEAVVVSSVDGAGTVVASHPYATEGLFTVQVCVEDDGGAIGCDSLEVRVEAGGSTSVCEFPAFDGPEWSLTLMGDADQGQAAVVGNALHLSGDGSSLYHGADNGAFYHRQIATSADFRLEVDVADFPVDAGGQVRKAALMLRGGLGPYDPRVMVTLVPHMPGAAPEDPDAPALQFDARTVPGGGGVEIGNTVFGVTMPARLAIEKRGDVLTTYYSLDGGVHWTRPVDATYHGAAEIDFSAFGASETLYAGVMVASYDPQVAVTAELTDFAVCQPDADPAYDPGDAPLCQSDQPQDILFLLDVSGSMTAAIDGSPSKLEAAQEAIAQLSSSLQASANGSRAALVTYAGFRTPEENLAGAYQVRSGFHPDPTVVAGLASSIDPASIDSGTTTPVALAFEGVIDLLLSERLESHQTTVVWLTDGIANIDSAGRGPDAYALDELQGISLYDATGEFLPWGQVAWAGNFNGELGTFDGEPLANAMFQLQRLDAAIPDALVYGLALQGNGVDLGTFNDDLLQYAAYTSGGRSFSAASRDALLAAMGAVETDLDCGGFGDGSLAGRVWLDSDADGVDDAESGLASVRVELFDGSGFGLTSMLTQSDGTYLFDLLPAGNFSVQVDASSLPAESNIPTFDLDGIETPHVAGLEVLEGQTVGGVDFGYAPEPDDSGVDCDLDTFEGSGVDPAWSFIELGDADQGEVTVDGGQLLLTSDGSSLFHGDDNATWLYRSVQGDFRAETRIDAIPQDTGGAVRKACLIVRDGTQVRDARVMACFIPHLPDPPVAALQFDVRHLDGSAEELATLVTNVFLPVAVAIERRGDTFSVEYSRDGGNTWTSATGQLGGSVELAVGEEVLWGLAVASYHTDITMTAAFEHAEICRFEEPQP